MVILLLVVKGTTYFPAVQGTIYMYLTVVMARTKLQMMIASFQV